MARIEHVALFAEDAPALRSFYERTFGMRTVRENPGPPTGYFLLDEGGMSLEIIQRPAGPGVDQRYVSHVAFWVDDVAATRSALETSGLVFEEATAVNSAEMMTCFFRDPAGNRIQIIHRFVPLDPNEAR